MADGDSTCPTPYGIIYMVTHVATGRVYIGQTVQPLAKRWADHQKCGYCQRLYRAIKKYGPDAFEVRQIDTADSKQELDDLEVFYITKYRATEELHGFNLRAGGSFGKHSDASKKKMSEKVLAAMARPEVKAKLMAVWADRVGKKQSPAFCAAVSAGLVGKKVSDEAKAKMSAARKALWADPEARERMRQASIEARNKPEFRQQVSERAKAQWQEPEFRKKHTAAALEGRLASWRDPEKKAARLAKLAATKARKKAGEQLALDLT